jgi:hypothetical protein
VVDYTLEKKILCKEQTFLTADPGDAGPKNRLVVSGSDPGDETGAILR